jgi:flagellar protein FlbD
VITLTRLGNNESFQLNPDMVVTVEANPDTVIALATGVKVVVTQTPEQVADAISSYRSLVLSDALRRRRPERSPAPVSALRDQSHLLAVDDPPA